MLEVAGLCATMIGVSDLLLEYLSGADRLMALGRTINAEMRVGWEGHMAASTLVGEMMRDLMVR